MIKQKYNILVQQDGKKCLKEISGYIYKIDGMVFGVDKRYKHHWQVTELSTGRAIGCGIPRLQDIYTLLDEEKRLLIKNALKKSEVEIVNDIDRF